MKKTCTYLAIVESRFFTFDPRPKVLNPPGGKESNRVVIFQAMPFNYFLKFFLNWLLRRMKKTCTNFSIVESRFFTFDPRPKVLNPPGGKESNRVVIFQA